MKELAGFAHNLMIVPVLSPEDESTIVLTPYAELVLCLSEPNYEEAVTKTDEKAIHKIREVTNVRVCLSPKTVLSLAVRLALIQKDMGLLMESTLKSGLSDDNCHQESDKECNSESVDPIDPSV